MNDNRGAARSPSSPAEFVGRKGGKSEGVHVMLVAPDDDTAVRTGARGAGQGRLRRGRTRPDRRHGRRARRGAAHFGLSGRARRRSVDRHLRRRRSDPGLPVQLSHRLPEQDRRPRLARHRQQSATSQPRARPMLGFSGLSSLPGASVPGKKRLIIIEQTARPSDPAPSRLGIVGVGKIVRDQHLPALAKDRDYRLVAAASRHGKVDDIPNFPQPSRPCSTRCPNSRPYRSACRRSSATMRRGRRLTAKKHVFLEKPPGATVSEVRGPQGRWPRGNGVSLFASWHSRYAPAVEAARTFLWLNQNQLGCHRLERRCPPLAPEPGLDLGTRRFRRLRSRHQRAVDRNPHPAADVHHCGHPRLSREPRLAGRCPCQLPHLGRFAGHDGTRLAADGTTELGHPGRYRQGQDGAVRRRHQARHRRQGGP